MTSSSQIFRIPAQGVSTMARSRDGSGRFVPASATGVGDTPGRGAGDTPGRGAGDTPGRGAGDTPGRGVGDTPGRGAGDTPGRGVGDTPGRGRRAASSALIALMLVAAQLVWAQNGPPAGIGPPGGGPPSARAQVWLSNVTTAYVLDYSLTTVVEVIGTLRVHQIGQATEYFVTFSAGAGGTFDNRTLVGPSAGQPIVYNIYSPTNVVLVDRSVTVSTESSLSGSFAESDVEMTRDHTFVVRVPADQFALQGAYNDAVTVQLWSGSPTGGGASVQMKDEAAITFNTSVPNLSQLSIVDRGADDSSGTTARTVDFGTLQAGQFHDLDILFRANIPYVLSMNSQNNGVLKHADIEIADTIAYSVAVDSTVDYLNSGSLIIGSNTNGTDAAWTRIALSFTILPFSGAAFGRYSDVITVSISAM